MGWAALGDCIQLIWHVRLAGVSEQGTVFDLPLLSGAEIISFSSGWASLECTGLENDLLFSLVFIRLIALGLRETFRLVLHYSLEHTRLENDVWHIYLWVLADLSSIASIRLGSGPIGLIFSSFVSFFFDIPVSTRFKLLGVEVSEKSFVYFVGLQVCNCSLFVSVGFRLKSWSCNPFENKVCLEAVECSSIRSGQIAT